MKMEQQLSQTWNRLSDPKLYAKRDLCLLAKPAKKNKRVLEYVYCVIIVLTEIFQAMPTYPTYPKTFKFGLELNYLSV